ncbi:hypothetical protein ABK040_009129 [Willaertia magna]
MTKKKKGEDVNLSDEQLEKILKKILRETEQSIIRYINTEQNPNNASKSKRKTTTFRVCPMCDRAVGNFGTNFKNHFRKCCPMIYDELMDYQPLYFGTWNQLIESGLIKGKVIEDEDELETLLRRTSNYHELCSQEGFGRGGGDKENEEDNSSVGSLSTTLKEEENEEGEDEQDEDSQLKKIMRGLAKEQKKQHRRSKQQQRKKATTQSNVESPISSSVPSTPSSSVGGTTPLLMNSPQILSSTNSQLLLPNLSNNNDSWLANPNLYVKQMVEETRLEASKKDLTDLGDEDYSIIEATNYQPAPYSSLSISQSWDECVYKKALERYAKNNSYIHEIFFGEIKLDFPQSDETKLKSVKQQLEKLSESLDAGDDHDEQIIDTFVSTQGEFYSTLNSIHKGIDDNELKEKKRVLSQILAKQHYHSQAIKKPKNLQEENEKAKQLIEL